MPSNVSKVRRAKAFDEGRRAARASDAGAENPYDNPTLAELWERGRAMEAAGQILTPIPPLAHGETRARRMSQNPPGRQRVVKLRTPSQGAARTGSERRTPLPR